MNKGLLEYIKMYPQCFSDTCYARSRTTPNLENKKNHLNLKLSIDNKNWEMVLRIIEQSGYQSALQEVLIFLITYSNIPEEVYGEIFDNFVE